eukprot:COSAG01_NODE_28339_length_663_cov_1.631206_2_plen_81_part_00
MARRKAFKGVSVRFGCSSLSENEDDLPRQARDKSNKHKGKCDRKKKTKETHRPADEPPSAYSISLFECFPYVCPEPVLVK